MPGPGPTFGPGPVLALVSGAHGTEYASIIALEKVIQTLDPAQISGTVIIVPLLNIASFEQKEIGRASCRERV